MKYKNNHTLVFNVQKCSIHDGPGIRTVVFLKGCPMRCLWCANPESQAYYQEIADTPAHCIGCKACVAICPEKCIKIQEDNDGKILTKIDRSRCTRCGKCTEVCHAQAKRIIGEEETPDQLVDELIKDWKYFKNSGGGVTFSGGEPLTHPDYLKKVLKQLKEKEIHTAIESCGYAMYEKFEEILEYIDLVYMDIKEINPIKHQVFTGRKNNIIIDNLKKINQAGKDIIIRIPVIPGYNDSKENLKGIAELAASCDRVKSVELLAYHALGVHKYAMLNRKYLLKNVKTPTELEMEKYVSIINQTLEQTGKKCFYEKQ